MLAAQIALSLTLSAVAISSESTPSIPHPSKPNIIVIYADDLGYGDVGCYGAKRIPTPNIDRLASAGQRFTNGYATSATCTPSRYALLTGEYPWRVGARILSGEAGLIVKTGRATLPSILRSAGYRTAAIGKWHLGLGEGQNDWNKPLKPGPLELGYDYSFLMAATMDRVPCVYVRGHDVVGLDPADPIQISYKTPFVGELIGRSSPPESMRMLFSRGHDGAIINGIPRIGYMHGGKAASWVDEDMADVYNREAITFMEANKGRPFFIYLGHSDPHVPRLPNKRFVGATTLGPRGDSIVQFDWSVGEIMSNLKRLGLDRNTMVILTSDNGPVLDDGYKDGAKEMNGDHTPWGPLQGGKYSNYEAGTRVPFIVHWPARVKAGVSDALVSQIDFAASFAALTGCQLKQEDVPDSFNVLPALLGESPTGRDYLITDAGCLGVRQGNWKYIESSSGRDGKKKNETDSPMLFHLATDLHEDTNIAAQHPDQVKVMSALIDHAKKATYTRP
ncbi:MAG: arylsulfatase [Planctomycetota bacterium]